MVIIKLMSIENFYNKLILKIEKMMLYLLKLLIYLRNIIYIIQVNRLLKELLKKKLKKNMNKRNDLKELMLGEHLRN